MKEHCITITFGDRAENHVGMQKIGKLSDRGFSIGELKMTAGKVKEMGGSAKMIDLSTRDNPAAILIIDNGIDLLLKKQSKKLEKQSKKLEKQLLSLPWDTKCMMYGRVVNKRARHNLCFSSFDQEPDYKAGKGRVISFDKILLLRKLREQIGLLLPAAKGLEAEGNLYPDITKCGIGFHGDSERRKVVGVRLGSSMILKYKWFYRNSEIVGKSFEIMLNHGDIYIMSEKAVGFDWKKSSIRTLRHAAGCAKFTK